MECCFNNFGAFAINFYFNLKCIYRFTIITKVQFFSHSRLMIDLVLTQCCTLQSLATVFSLKLITSFFIFPDNFFMNFPILSSKHSKTVYFDFIRFGYGLAIFT